MNKLFIIAICAVLIAVAVVLTTDTVEAVNWNSKGPSLFAVNWNS